MSKSIISVEIIVSQKEGPKRLPSVTCKYDAEEWLHPICNSTNITKHESVGATKFKTPTYQSDLPQSNSLKTISTQDFKFQQSC